MWIYEIYFLSNNSIFKTKMIPLKWWSYEKCLITVLSDMTIFSIVILNLWTGGPLEKWVFMLTLCNLSSSESEKVHLLYVLIKYCFWWL